jgi:hypothetical protein
MFEPKSLKQAYTLARLQDNTKCIDVFYRGTGSRGQEFDQDGRIKISKTSLHPCPVAG